MFKPPKIVITNVDEDATARKARKRKKITELLAVCSIVAVNWIMVLSKSCFVFGVLSGILTTLITIMQYCLLVKTHYASHFGAKRQSAHFREHISVGQTIRWTVNQLTRCSTCLQRRLRPHQNSLPK